MSDRTRRVAIGVNDNVTQAGTSRDLECRGISRINTPELRYNASHPLSLGGHYRLHRLTEALFKASFRPNEILMRLTEPPFDRLNCELEILTPRLEVFDVLLRFPYGLRQFRPILTKGL